MRLNKRLGCMLLVGTFSVIVLCASPVAALKPNQFPASSDVRRCKVVHRQPDSRRFARARTLLNTGAPRTVRTIYFVPNDRTFRANWVRRIQVKLRLAHEFFAEQMKEYQLGDSGFRYETDDQGEPMVHRVDGQHSEDYYFGNMVDSVLEEIEAAFDLNSNIYLIVVDNSIDAVDGALGVGGRWSKTGGFGMIPTQFEWVTLAHELGHAFGLEHDFSDNSYIMSYGPGEDKLSSCNAHYLAAHSYFNQQISLEDAPAPTVDLLSPSRYPEGAINISVDLKASDPDGLHQVLLLVNTPPPHGAVGAPEIKACRRFSGESVAFFSFDYDGVIPSNVDLVASNQEFADEGGPTFERASLSYPVVHPVTVAAVDMDGNVEYLEIQLSEESPYHIVTLQAHTNAVDSVMFSPDGASFASQSWDGTVKLWDAPRKAYIASLAEPAISMDYSPNGSTLATLSWDGMIWLWNAETGTHVSALGHTGDESLVIAYSPEGNTLAVGAWDGSVALWDTETKSEVAVYEPHADAVFALEYSPDGATLASGSGDATVNLWSVATRENIVRLEPELNTWDFPAPIEGIAFSPDGNNLASSAWNGITVWHGVSPESVPATLGYGISVFSLAYAPDSNTLAAGSWDGMVNLWDSANGERIDSFGHSSPVYSVAFSPNGAMLIAGTEAGTVELWDTSWLRRVEPAGIAGDVNRDGAVNILDLVFVASMLGEEVADPIADVNGDGVVNILDLVFVASVLG